MIRPANEEIVEHFYESRIPSGCAIEMFGAFSYEYRDNIGNG